jgi:tetratricopeptide (TPR) repeat protein
MRCRIIALLLAVTMVLSAEEREISPYFTDDVPGPKEITAQIRHAADLVGKGALDEAAKTSRSVIADAKATEAQKGNAQYGLGVVLAKQQDWEAALAAFAVVTRSAALPVELKAMAYEEAAKIHLQNNRKGEALKMLTAAIELPEAPTRVIGQIVAMRATVRDSLGQNAAATEDYKLLADVQELPPGIRAMALARRAASAEIAGDFAAAIVDTTAILNLSPPPAYDALALARINRSHYYLVTRKFDLAEEDCTFVIEQMPGIGMARVVAAFYNRAGAKENLGDKEGAVADYTKITRMPGGPARERSLARIQLAELYVKGGKTAEALAILRDVIADASAPVALIGHASSMRGGILLGSGKDKAEEALDDLTRAILLPATGMEPMANALLNRGTVNLQAGRRDQALKDFQSIINNASMPVDFRAQAWQKLAELHRSNKKVEEAISDIGKGLAMPELNPARKVRMLRQRVMLLESVKRYADATADMDAVMKLPRPFENQMLDLLYRASLLSRQKRYDEMLADLAKVVDTPKVPTKLVSEALRLRAEFHKATGDTAKADADNARRAKLPKA